MKVLKIIYRIVKGLFLLFTGVIIVRAVKKWRSGGEPERIWPDQVTFKPETVDQQEANEYSNLAVKIERMR